MGTAVLDKSVADTGESHKESRKPTRDGKPGKRYHKSSPVNPHYLGRCPVCGLYVDADTIKLAHPFTKLLLGTHKSRKGDPCPGTGHKTTSWRYKRTGRRIKGKFRPA